jgi:autotransporter-associated beta strand protein
MKKVTKENFRRGNRAESRLARRALALLLAAYSIVGTVPAADLTIDGGEVAIWNKEAKSYGNLYVGSTNGNGTLVAVDSTIDLSNYIYFGYQAGDSSSVTYSSTLVLTNTSLACHTFNMGYYVKGGAGGRDGTERIQAEIGPGSVVTIADKMNRNCQPWSRVRFTGGKVVFARSVPSPAVALVICFGRDAGSGYYNTGMTWEGVDAPIDIEVAKDAQLASGWDKRGFYLEGNGGFVKRGSGVLNWGWRQTNGPNTLMGEASYTGNTVIKEGGIRIDTPYSKASESSRYSIPSASPLVIEDGAFFDFAGNDAAWVSVSGGGILKNSSAAAATLTLGAGNADCSLEAASAIGPINAVKNGTGTLTVNVPELDGSLTVANGTLKVKRGSSFAVGSIMAASGTTLDFRGATVRCGELTVPADVTILRDADTDFSYTLNSDSAVRLVAGTLPAKGDFTKTGSGTLTLVGPCAKTSGSINIAEGSVVCEAAQPFNGKFFRLKYGRAAKRAVDSSDNASLQFSEFSLYGVGGTRVNEGGFTYNPILLQSGTYANSYDGIGDATTLDEREVAVWMPEHSGYFMYDTDATYGGSPLAAFDGSMTTKLRNTYYWESSSIVVFRMESGSEDALGFTFTTSDYPVRRPTEWTLEGSVDGSAWVMLASHVADSSLSDEEKWLWRTNSTPDTVHTEYNGGFPYTFDNLALADGYAPFGDATVSVAGGATLTLDPKMTVTALRVDMSAGAGSILGGFTPAENGILHLDNVVGGKIAGVVNIPLTIAEIVNAARFKTWTVYVNGRVADCSVRWNGECVVVCAKSGLTVFVR